ncbi:hypothetical protein CO653_30405 [Rhizobium anhuiense]|nr:hypothetical protein CO653_30405 [Rhizobium anhuiense]
MILATFGQLGNRHLSRALLWPRLAVNVPARFIGRNTISIVAWDVRSPMAGSGAVHDFAGSDRQRDQGLLISDEAV